MRHHILDYKFPVCVPVYTLSSAVSRRLLTFYGFLFINWKHDGVLSGAWWMEQENWESH